MTLSTNFGRTLPFVQRLLDYFTSRQGHLQTSLTIVSGVALAASVVVPGNLLPGISVAAGSYFALKSAFGALKDRELDVNILMVLAALGAIVVGQIRDAAALLFLFSLSSSLESFAMAKTRSAIEKLIQLRPSTAIRIVGEREDVVPVEDLVVGDMIRILSFEKIPLDGVLVEGASSVDESALTGESLPVAKKLGSIAVAGTQNMDGSFILQVTKVVGNSSLDHIIALVDEAQKNKASGEKISSWFGQRYTIFVLAAFFITFIGRTILGQVPSDAFYSALILLVGLSPCALVISTPASTLSALANAAKQGILVRGGEFIEKVADIQTVAFDKTGTLTGGKPSLVKSIIINSLGRPVIWSSGEPIEAEFRQALGTVAGIEIHATHPLARALVQTAISNKVVLEKCLQSQTIPGLGISASIRTIDWHVGNEELFQRVNVSIPNSLLLAATTWKHQGMTVVFAIGGTTSAAFAFLDTMRPEAEDVVNSLRSLGIDNILMLTGDKRETAEAIAQSVGIREVRAGLRPEGKIDIVETLSQSGHVMMVGDGINDAPSLAKATVGVAMGGLGSDIALEAADVVLMNDKLNKLPDLIKLGKRTKRTIRTNIVFSLVVICSLAIASFFVKLPLPLAVIAHEGSTVLVILNGLRLLR